MVSFKKNVAPEQNKKVVRLIHFDALNTLIKDEASTDGKTEAAIIESAISDRYLNTLESEMASSVMFCIADEDAVNKICISVFAYYAAMPSHANKESLLPLLSLCFSMSVHKSVRIDKSIPCLVHFRSQLETIYNFFKNCYENDVVCVDTDGENTVSNEVVMYFEMLLNNVDSVLSGSNEYTDWSCGEIGHIIAYLKDYFEFGNLNGVIMGRWSYFYRLLHDIAEICLWDNTVENRYKLTKIIKNITFSNTKSIVNVQSSNPNVTKLEKTVFLKDKVIVTTRDAVILKTHPEYEENAFTQARRVIHGINGKDTERPFIILFVDSDKPELENMLHELVRSYPSEFPIPEDSFPVQIYTNQTYYDPRIKWESV